MTKKLSKAKQPAVSEPRRKMDWKLVVRPRANIPPSGHKMETDAREYLEANRAASLQHSASESTQYMKDPPLRVPSRTEGRSQRPSAVQPRQEKTVLQPMVYRRQALANTSSNPVLKEYRREHIPTEGHAGALKINWPTPFLARIMESPPFPKQASRECYLTTLKPSSWRGEKSERPKAMKEEPAEKLKGQISELKNEVEQTQMKFPQESRPSILLPSKKWKYLAMKEEKASSEEVMAIMGMGLERPELVERPPYKWHSPIMVKYMGPKLVWTKVHFSEKKVY
ncbi:hypothetical protein BVRB_6g144740 [Beta vulgaris subsp. vulgaris]|nr:hypothetical protein BVRB_6g144740 [Beta vulgaris subsp. vulgaris]